MNLGEILLAVMGVFFVVTIAGSYALLRDLLRRARAETAARDAVRAARDRGDLFTI